MLIDLVSDGWFAPWEDANPLGNSLSNSPGCKSLNHFALRTFVNDVCLHDRKSFALLDIHAFELLSTTNRGRPRASIASSTPRGS